MRISVALLIAVFACSTPACNGLWSKKDPNDPCQDREKNEWEFRVLWENVHQHAASAKKHCGALEFVVRYWTNTYGDRMRRMEHIRRLCKFALTAEQRALMWDSVKPMMGCGGHPGWMETLGTFIGASRGEPAPKDLPPLPLPEEPGEVAPISPEQGPEAKPE